MALPDTMLGQRAEISGQSLRDAAFQVMAINKSTGFSVLIPVGSL